MHEQGWADQHHPKNQSCSLSKSCREDQVTRHAGAPATWASIGFAEGPTPTHINPFCLTRGMLYAKIHQDFTQTHPNHCKMERFNCRLFSATPYTAQPSSSPSVHMLIKIKRLEMLLRSGNQVF